MMSATTIARAAVTAPLTALCRNGVFYDDVTTPGQMETDSLVIRVGSLADLLYTGSRRIIGPRVVVVRILTLPPDPRERASLNGRFQHVQEPKTATEILQRYAPSRHRLTEVRCTSQLLRSDRFTLRVEAVEEDGQRQCYAMKGYIDDRGEQIMRVYEALAAFYEQRQESCPLCVPLAYAAKERVIISPWIEGEPPWSGAGSNRVELLQQFATILARTHASPVIPEPPTSSEAIVDVILGRCERLCSKKRWRAAWETIELLMAAIQEAYPFLDPAGPALVHGDPKPEHFLRDGDRLILLDLDSFGYADPAYDVGYFLAQLHLDYLRDQSLRDGCSDLLETFRSAYLDARPATSPRNISFYYGLSLTRKCYNVCRKPPPEWMSKLSQMAQFAMCAFQDVQSPAIGE